MDRQNNQFVYKDSNLMRTKGLALLFMSGLYILLSKIDFFSLGARGNVIEKIAWIVLGMSIIIVLSSSDLTVTADKSLRILRLHYHSPLFQRTRDISFNDIADIQSHSDRGNIELPSNAYSDSAGGPSFRLIVVLKDGSKIPFRRYFNSYNNKEIAADLRSIVIGSRHSDVFKVKSTDFTLPIKMTVCWWAKLLFIFGVLLFVYFAVLSYLSDHDVFTSLLFLVFALLCVYTYISSQSTIEINQDSITLSSPPHGVYKMYWSDVRYVETNGVTFAFVGDGKHLAISLVFVGNRKREFLNFLNDLVEKRPLDVKPLSSMRLTQKNTKVG